jgi:hypothetical protein
LHPYYKNDKKLIELKNLYKEGFKEDPEINFLRKIQNNNNIDNGFIYLLK